MNRLGKEAVVASLKENFSQSSASFLVTVKGLTVAQLESLRIKLRVKQGSLQVAKVRLMKRALQDAGHSQLDGYMKDQIGLVFAKAEALEIAKVICDFSKEVEGLQILAGAMGADVLDAKTVKKIAALPSREVLLAQVAYCLLAPITKLACALQQVQENKAQVNG